MNDSSDVSSRNITESGEYILEVINENSCSNTDTVIVTVNDLPIVNLGEDIIGTNITTVVLKTEELNYKEYLWSDSSISNTLFVDFAYIESQIELSLAVLDSNNCTNSDTILLTKVDELAHQSEQPQNENTISEASDEVQAEEELENISDYKIYPNPANGKFFINLPKPEQLKKIDIFDSRGMLIKSYTNVATNILEVDISNYAKGIYLIYILDKETTREFKVIYQ